MTCIAIEVNDAGLELAMEGQNQPTAEPSPGYALVSGSGIVVGQAAASRARQHPRHVDHRFWDRLDSSLPGAPFPPTTTHADLAHAHLQELWKTGRAGLPSGAPDDEDEVLLAVPGWYSPQQLGLLLGIARAAEIPVTGLVDSALAAVADHRSDLPTLYLDVQLHRTAASWIEGTTDRIVRRSVECAEEAGLVELHAIWAREIAERFVRQTRFDPLHDAASEQRLYDHLADWIDTPMSPESLSLDAIDSGDVPRIELPEGFWSSMVEPIYDRIVAAALAVRQDRTIGTLVLSARAATLPGLADRLAKTTGTEPQTVAPSAAVRGALRHAAAIRNSGEGLPFITMLPVADTHTDSGGLSTTTGSEAPDPVSKPRPRPLSNRVLPTHLLHEGLASPLGDRPIEIGTAKAEDGAGLQLTRDTAGISRLHCRILRLDDTVVVEDLSRYGTFLNDRRVADRRELLAGDRLRLGSPGVELQLIAIAGSINGERHGKA